MKSVSRALLCVALGAAAAWAQAVISAKSGMIHYLEGQVFLGDQALESKFGSFPEVKENQVLRTAEGRAEVLLTPGVFLRLAENSSFRMVTNRLVDTRLEVLSGAAVFEVDEMPRDNGVTAVLNNSSVRLMKKGLYRFDAQPPAVRVFDGEALATSGDRNVEVKEGKMLTLDSDLAVARFDKETTDALDRWSRRRGHDLAMANVYAANSLRTSGATWLSSGWVWNPYFGMFTFVPYGGAFSSPYGYRFWSPLAVYRIYQPRVYYGGNNFPSSGRGGGYGYGTVAHTSSGYSGVIASAPVSVSSSAPAAAAHAPSTSTAAAPAAPVSRGGASAGGAHR